MFLLEVPKRLVRGVRCSLLTYHPPPPSSRKTQKQNPLQTGVFRSDLPEKFRLVPSALQSLIDNVDRDLTFAIEVESGVQRDTVSNYDEVKSRSQLCSWWCAEKRMLVVVG